jgi:hypothetical protein
VKEPGRKIGPTVVLVPEVPIVAPFQPSPVAPPLAVHDAAPVVVQSSTIDWPAETVVGVAVNVAMDAGGVGWLPPELTVNVVDTFPLPPPAPVQFSVYV